MKAIICVDDNNGVLFNGRRVSRDALLTADILDNLGDSNLYIRPFSESLFKDTEAIVSESFDEAKDEDFCFIEDIDVKQYLEKLSDIIVYKWNREYPSDIKFNVDLEETGYELTDTKDFEGKSHDKITREVWSR